VFTVQLQTLYFCMELAASLRRVMSRCSLWLAFLSRNRVTLVTSWLSTGCMWSCVSGSCTLRFITASVRYLSHTHHHHINLLSQIQHHHINLPSHTQHHHINLPSHTQHHHINLPSQIINNKPHTLTYHKHNTTSLTQTTPPH
jgi:hypothetical protein